MNAKDAIAQLEALGVTLEKYERETIDEMTPEERTRYVEKREPEMKGFLATTRIKETHREFMHGREELARVLSERLTKIIPAPNMLLEEKVRVVVHHRSGKLQLGSRPPPPKDGSWSCLDSTGVPGQRQLLELFRIVEHLPARLEPWTTEVEAIGCVKHDSHAAALTFAGWENVEEETGLAPCACGGVPAKHRYQARDVRIHIGPYGWSPGEFFDAPCAETEEELEAFVRTGHLVDRHLKQPKKPAPKAPAPSAEEMLAARLKELGAPPSPREGD